MTIRTFYVSSLLLAAFLTAVPRTAWCHGGGGGFGGGGFGGGGFGGGGHGGGFGGGFGGGHGGGFGGGHGGFGGFGGGHGGFGGFSGGHHGGGMGGFSGGHHGGGMGGFSGGHHGGFAPGGGNIGGHHSGAPALGGIHHGGLHGATGAAAAPFTHHHAVGPASTTHGYRGVNGGSLPGSTGLTSHSGNYAQSLLNHAHGAGLTGAGGSHFLQHHQVGSDAAGQGLATAGGLHHGAGNFGAGHLGAGGAGAHHHGMGNHHHFAPGFFGFGYPFFFPFYGYGLGSFYGLGGYGLYGYGYPYYGYGYGYGYPNYGYGYGYPYAGYGAYVGQTAQAGSTDNAQTFAEQGEVDFKNGDYKAAAYAWRHAAVDDPKNGVILMMLGQALFATGQYDEAAGATQQAMQLLPDDKWDVVVANFRELYGKKADYTTQLRALEKSVKQKPDDPASRFLLGFHYGYLGYPGHAVKQLDKTLELAPQDELAKKLRDLMAAKEKQPAE